MKIVITMYKNKNKLMNLWINWHSQMNINIFRNYKLSCKLNNNSVKIVFNITINWLNNNFNDLKNVN